MCALTAFLLYAVAGRPIGALILFGVAAITMFFGPEGSAPFRVSVEEFVRGTVLIVGLAYLVGGMQSLLVAIVPLRRRKPCAGPAGRPSWPW